MTQRGLQNVRRSENEVTGSSGGTYVAVTCIGTMPRATAVIMAVGDNNNEVAAVRGNLAAKIAATVSFDD